MNIVRFGFFSKQHAGKNYLGNGPNASKFNSLIVQNKKKLFIHTYDHDHEKEKSLLKYI